VRITLIHNPGAGRQGATDAKKLRHFLVHHGHDVRYRSVKEKGWKKALKKKADLVVVAAGDGTVAKVARRMVGRGVPLSVLPSGTANNIARTLGLVERLDPIVVPGRLIAHFVSRIANEVEQLRQFFLAVLARAGVVNQRDAHGNCWQSRRY